MIPTRFPNGVAGGSFGNQNERWLIDEYGRANFSGSFIAATIATLGGVPLTFPAVAGQTGQVLTSDGANGTIWSVAAASGVTSITGTANQVIASAPSGAVTLSLPQNINTSASVQFGNIATAAASIGSTNVSTLTASGAALLQSTLGVSGLSALGPATITSLNVNGGLTVTGASALAALAVSGTISLSAPLTVPNGGTGVATITSGGVVYGNGTGAVLATAQGASGTVLAGASGAPSFTASPSLTSVTVSGGNFTLSENTALGLPGALSADGKYAGITESVTAAATTSFGDVVYLNSSSSQWAKAQATTDPTSGAVRVAIAVSSGSSGNPMTILTYGKIRADANFPTLTTGGPAYISTTAGKIQTTQPASTNQVIRILGYGNTTHEMFFNPSNDYITHT